MKHRYSLLLWGFIVLLFVQCAKRGNPTGGPKDENPPVLLRADPELNTTHFNEERVHQIKGAFSVVDPSIFIKKHILLIDDVVTTGATMSEAANCLLQIEGVRVSVATIAFAMSPLP